MVFTGIVATEADLDKNAGELVDTTGWTEANKNLWMEEVEGYLCCLVRYDIVTNWATLNNYFKKIFTEYASRYCANSGIAYNMGTVGATFSSLIEPEDMIQYNVYRMEQIQDLLSNGSVLNAIGIKE